MRKQLLRDNELTLTKAIEVCQIVYEQTEQHTKALAAPKQTLAKVDSLQHTVRKRQPQKLKSGMDQRASQSHSDQRSAHSTFNCNNCGNKHEARREKCPAYGQQCHKCEKWNHFQKCCKSSQTQGYKKRYVNQVETVQASSSDE